MTDQEQRMDFQFRRQIIADLHQSQQIEADCLTPAAHRVAGLVAAATPVDTGQTRATTRVERGHRSADGRSRAVRVVQDGASVQQQFGNSHERTPARQFDRGGV